MFTSHSVADDLCADLLLQFYCKNELLWKHDDLSMLCLISTCSAGGQGLLVLEAHSRGFGFKLPLLPDTFQCVWPWKELNVVRNMVGFTFCVFLSIKIVKWVGRLTTVLFFFVPLPCSHNAVSLYKAAWVNMMEEAASQLERDHVHSVYDKIAPYFNDSRYKAWPKVQQFLLDLPPGSLVADIGGFHLHKKKKKSL